MKTSESLQLIEQNSPFEIIIEGVKFNIYGLFYDVFNAHSKGSESVEDLLKNAAGVTYADSSVSRRVSGFDYKICDWLALNPAEMFKKNFAIFFKPRALVSIVKSMPFTASKDSYEVGQLDCAQYLNSYIEKEKSLSGLNADFFSDKRMHWLSSIESISCFPYRAFYVIEYTLYHAKMNGYREVSVFCGEPNAQLAKYLAPIRDELEHPAYELLEEVRKSVRNNIENPYYFRYRNFLSKSGAFLGLLAALSIYAIAAVITIPL